MAAGLIARDHIYMIIVTVRELFACRLIARFLVGDHTISQIRSMCAGMYDLVFASGDRPDYVHIALGALQSAPRR